MPYSAAYDIVVLQITTYRMQLTVAGGIIVALQSLGLLGA
jgi:hypothetical protein